MRFHVVPLLVEEIETPLGQLISDLKVRGEHRWKNQGREHRSIRLKPTGANDLSFERVLNAEGIEIGKAFLFRSANDARPIIQAGLPPKQPASAPQLNVLASYQMLRIFFAFLLFVAPLAHAVEFTIITTTGYGPVRSAE